MNTKHSEWTGIIYRGGMNRPGFYEMIYDLLKKGNLTDKHINDLLSPENLSKLDKAFTSKSAYPQLWQLEATDPAMADARKQAEHNYEIYEQLGDLSVNKFIVWYAYRRFPQLECSMGVKVVARLRINYGSRAKFAEIGQSLGFWEYITADEGERSTKMKDLLEDVVEAFIGCVEQILDRQYRPGVGYGIVHDILSAIFDKMEISLRYDDLYDPKTRLKELYDHCTKNHTWRFTENKTDNLVTSSVWHIPVGTSKDLSQPQKDWKLLARGVASRKADAQQEAARAALGRLREQGWSRPMKDEYLYFAE